MYQGYEDYLGHWVVEMLRMLFYCLCYSCVPVIIDICWLVLVVCGWFIHFTM